MMAVPAETLLVSAGLGLLSNLIAEWLLTYEMRLPFGSLEPDRKRMRMMRWVGLVLGFILVGLFNPGIARLFVLGLFSVSAATDLETSYLPPDWFVYGATVAAVLLGYATGGLPGLRDAVVAEAVCFAMMVLAVLLANAADSGDIKLLMQYGAACGSLYAVGIGIAGEFVVRIGILVTMFVIGSLRYCSASTAFRDLARLRTPHGPIAWAGLVLALVVTSSAW